jgi:hypothetical protein
MGFVLLHDRTGVPRDCLDLDGGGAYRLLGLARFADLTTRIFDGKDDVSVFTSPPSRSPAQEGGRFMAAVVIASSLGLIVR